MISFYSFMMLISTFSFLVVGIPFVFMWRYGKHRWLLATSYIFIGLLIFICIDRVFTCYYTDGCGNGNPALALMPGGLLFVGFGLYALSILIYKLNYERRGYFLILLVGIVSLFFSLVGEYLYVINHLKALGIYSDKEWFVETIMNAGYFNQYLNRIHFNGFVWGIFCSSVVTIVSFKQLWVKR